MGVKKEDILKKLETIEKSLSAKCHPMQDYSTLKLAMLELVEVMKSMSLKSPSSVRRGKGR